MAVNVGEIVVKTKVDNKGFEKNINKMQKDVDIATEKIKKLEQEKEKIFEQQNQNDLRLEQYYEQLEEKQKTDEAFWKEMAQNPPDKDIRISMKKIGDERWEKYWEPLVKEANELEERLYAIDNEQDKYRKTIIETNKQIQATKILHQENQRQLQEEVEEAKKLAGIRKIINEVGKGLNKTINKIKYWGMALIGVRTLYSLISRAINQISSEDAQLKADLDYMRSALAYAVEPIVRQLVDLMKKLLFLIQGIVYAFTGKNIFENANKSLEKATGSAKGLNKELNKTLAGFDEMNVLQDNSSSGSGGGAGITTPSFDLTEVNMDETWLGWIIKHKDELLGLLAGIVTALTLIKLGVELITALGIGALIGIVVFLIASLLDYLKDPTWENFGKILQGIALAIIAVGVAVGGVVGLIIGVCALIYATIIKYWDKIKLKLDNAMEILRNNSGLIRQVFGDAIGDIYDTFISICGKMFEGWDNTFTAMRKTFDLFIQLIKAIISGDWRKAWQTALEIVKTIFDTMVRNIKLAFSSIWDVLKLVGTQVGNILWGAIKGVVNGVMWTLEQYMNGPITAINSLIGLINKVPGINLNKLSKISLPRLAKGGIINQPGRGVMLGSAIAGERGREGVIPLTDSQQMALLGESIGKYININATIPVYMGNRMVQREMRKIQAEDDFAFNR